MFSTISLRQLTMISFEDSRGGLKSTTCLVSGHCDDDIYDKAAHCITICDDDIYENAGHLDDADNDP